VGVRGVVVQDQVQTEMLGRLAASLTPTQTAPKFAGMRPAWLSFLANRTTIIESMSRQFIAPLPDGFKIRTMINSQT
jgi:hypothetical protein